MLSLLDIPFRSLLHWYVYTAVDYQGVCFYLSIFTAHFSIFLLSPRIYLFFFWKQVCFFSRGLPHSRHVAIGDSKIPLQGCWFDWKDGFEDVFIYHFTQDAGNVVPAGGREVEAKIPAPSQPTPTSSRFPTNLPVFVLNSTRVNFPSSPPPLFSMSEVSNHLGDL